MYIFYSDSLLSRYFLAIICKSEIADYEKRFYKKWLQSDACSSILFNLNNNIYLSETQLSSSVILLPVSKQAHTITLPPGTQLAGLRFHPAISFGIFGKHYDKPTEINHQDKNSFNSLNTQPY